MATNTFKGTDINTGSSTNYSFTSKDIGAPSSTRIIVVGIHQVGGTGGKTVTGTVDGVALTNIQQGTGRLHLAYAVVNTANSTGNIDLTFSSAPSRCAIGWWYLDGYVTTHSDVDSVFTTTDASRTLTALTIPTAGVAIIVGVNITAAAIATSISAGSIAEDYDTSATGMEYVGARTSDAGTPTITMNAVSSMAGFAFTEQKSLTAGAGAHTFAGTAVTLRHAWKLAAGAGAHTFAGANVTLAKGRKVAAASGAHTFAGTSVTLRHAWKLVVGVGAHTFAGTNLTLHKGYTIVAGSGSHTFAGTNVALSRGRKVAAGTGAHAFAGTSVSLRHARELVAGSGSHSFTGTSITLKRGWVTTVSAGAHAFSGSDISFVWGALVSRARVETVQIKSSVSGTSAKARVTASPIKPSTTVH